MARGSTLGGGLMYQQGALSVGGAYDQRRSNTGGGMARNYSLGASYVMGKATAYLGHMGRRESDTRAHFAIEDDGSFWLDGLLVEAVAA